MSHRSDTQVCMDMWTHRHICMGHMHGHMYSCTQGHLYGHQGTHCIDTHEMHGVHTQGHVHDTRTHEDIHTRRTRAYRHIHMRMHCIHRAHTRRHTSGEPAHIRPPVSSGSLSTPGSVKSSPAQAVGKQAGSPLRARGSAKMVLCPQPRPCKDALCRHCTPQPLGCRGRGAGHKAEQGTEPGQDSRAGGQVG